ncbi:N-acetylmuramoyl-L-alanine amidase [bacterium]|nr:N-acetylmuramoyl-L-alanine amidase [bacterium]
MFFILFAFAFAVSVKASNNAIVYRTGIQSGNVSRFVLETSQKPSYSIFYLTSPSRIIIDVDDLNISKIVRESSKSGFITNVRVSSFDKNKARIVLDLGSFAKVKNNFVLNPINSNNNYRFVVDIENATETEFKKLAKAEVSSTQKSVSKSDVVIEEEITSSKTNSKTPKKNDVSESSKNTGKTSITTTKTTTNKTTTTVSNPKKSKKQKIIVIDAGHGGHDPGAIGAAGVQEKNINLGIAKHLRDILNKNSQYKVIMTRSTDIFLPLTERSAIAEKNNADFFISIHINSSAKKSTKGFSIYTLNEIATDEESKKLAEKENASDLLGIGTFDAYDAITKNILGDLLQTQVKMASVEIASEIVNQVRQDSICLENPNREAKFTVLRSSVPSVLAEMGFISNKEEEKKLNQKWYQEKLAYALARGIDKMMKE